MKVIMLAMRKLITLILALSIGAMLVSCASSDDKSTEYPNPSLNLHDNE